MTFSIVARSADGSSWGVAVASKFLAAGAVVPGGRAGVGAVATQSFVELRYVPRALALLEQGVAAPVALEQLTAADPQAADRQVGLVDAVGRSASFTGDGCIPWAGSRTGQDYAVQGNCLAGEQVVTELERAFLAAPAEQPLVRRLLASLAAGDSAGGDRRGRQSAAVVVFAEGGGYGGGSDVLVDLRVDDSPAPVQELARLADLHDLCFGRPDPADVLPLEGDVAAEVDRLLTGLGRGGDAPLQERLLDWMGWENYEERHVPGGVDPVVLEQLRAAGQGAA